MFNCSYLLLMYKKAGIIILWWWRPKTMTWPKALKRYLSRALCWKKYLYLLYEEGVCFFRGMGEVVRLYFINFLVSHLYLLTLYLCIYWILFMSFWIFVIVFQGLLWGLYLQRGVFLRSRQEEKMPNECFKAKPNLKTVVL